MFFNSSKFYKKFADSFYYNTNNFKDINYIKLLSNWVLYNLYTYIFFM